MMLIHRGCWLIGLRISLATDVVPIYQVVNQSIILGEKKVFGDITLFSSAAKPQTTLHCKPPVGACETI